jgi:hypothetical protein
MLRVASRRELTSYTLYIRRRIVATRQTSKPDKLFVSRTSRNATNHHLSRVCNGDRGVLSALNVDGGNQPSIADGSPRHVWETLGRANIDWVEDG